MAAPPNFPAQSISTTSRMNRGPIEPAGTVNTGEVGGELTAPTDDWI